MRISLPPRLAATAAAFFILLLLVTACWAGITSNLLIEPGKQFALGGGQLGSFKVEAHNVGNVPVDFKERPRDGGIFGKTTLAPGARGTLRFMAGSTALLLNPSDQQAKVDLKITGDTKLSMRYEVNGKL
ncbi:hypothetical protein [Hymenobacter lapidiphilus]|uniref:Uncharacterized protein n=1 Tax=Hymenobacter lapidiphilus TaxID=2608003 RepID=A0A7Y7U451_9BACT|nr:hypothetical protein [Hymenobacter lapidiphilus]NVO30058.1 hypothetical protein [Hymenobacter lapidiphilus]